MNLKDIKINDIQKKIPGLILNKLSMLGIENLQQLVDFAPIDLFNYKGFGNRAMEEFVKFQHLLKENPYSVLSTASEEQSSIIDFEVNETFLKIDFESIRELIPQKLMLKFEKHGIKSFKELSLLSRKEFQKLGTVGASTMNLLDEFLNKGKSNPGEFLELYRFNQTGIIIPEVVEESGELLNSFKSFLNDYVIFIEKVEYRNAAFLKRYYGLGSSETFTMEEIASYFEISRERVRQIIENFIRDIFKVTSGESSNYGKVKCNSILVKKISALIYEVKKYKVLISSQVNEILFSKFNEFLSPELKPYFDLLIEVHGGRIGGKTETRFTNETIYFIDTSIDKKRFVETTRLVFEVLENMVLPISDFKLIVEAKKKSKNVLNDEVTTILKQFPEVEKISVNNEDLYQIRFDLLSNAGDMAERILYVNNQSLHIDAIVSDINRNLYLLNNKRTVTKSTVLTQLKDKKNIRPKGRTGIYTFTQWGENKEKISDIIKEAFLHFNKPLSHAEIIAFVQNVRPEGKPNAIRTITNMDYTRLTDNSYILNEWSNIYKNRIFKNEKHPKKKSSLQTAIEHLVSYPNHECEMSLVMQELKKKGVKQFAIYHSLGDKRYFEKYTNSSGVQIVKLLPQNKTEKKSQSDIITESIEIYFQTASAENLRLNEVVKKVHKSTKINKPTIYKIISERSNLFEKTISEGETWLSLIANKQVKTAIESSQWPAIKETLVRELEDVFKDSRQPGYPISLSESLEVLKKVIDAQTSEKDLNGLNEQLWFTIYKFYHSSNDRSDLLNYLKQISTSLDPFLQKVLYFIDLPSYNKLKNQRAGLGSLIKELNKLDDKDYRYKSHIKDVPIYKFSKHVHSAYNSRNQITHLAKNWSKQQVIDNFTSTLVVFVFTVFEYYSQLKQANI